MNSNPVFLMLLGVPGSGKSFFVKNVIPKIFPDKEFHIASTDDKIDAWAAKNNMNYSQAFKALSKDLPKFANEMFSELGEALKENKNIIVDRTNMSIKVRKQFLDMIPKNYIKIAVVFKIAPEEVQKRLKKREEETGKHIPEFVITNMLNSYQEPTDKEFDKIMFVEK